MVRFFILLFLLFSPFDLHSPSELDPELLKYKCLFKDVPIDRETIFDNWRAEIKKGWS